MMAASEGHLHIVRWLLSPEGGASISEADENGATALFHATGLLCTTGFEMCNDYPTMLFLLEECGADINHSFLEEDPPDTRPRNGRPANIWDYLQCKVFGEYHAALTPLLKVMTLLGDVPPTFKPELSVEHSLIMQKGPLLRRELPAYLERRQRLLLAHCPLPAVLQSLVAAFATHTWEDNWAAWEDDRSKLWSAYM